MINDDVVKTMLEQDPFLTISEIEERLNSAQQTILDHIWKIGLVWKYSRWVPHELSQKNLDDQVIICTSLLARNKIKPILNRMITGDKKWITYKNIIRKRAYCEPGKPSPSTSKSNLTLNKRMLCIWWDIQGPIHYELLKLSQKLNSEKYCQQLDDLKTAVQEKSQRWQLYYLIKFIDSYKNLYFVSFQKRTELSGRPNIFLIWF